ncbi:hypothetical protein E0485_18880 [Paenibacillus albiflavus]|uniref:PsbP C-terminal domain-containing protein n=1 Tax=Paenibacillus albiflavus TaxID=2545760 RepID=A0A4R4EAZ5_9BACL|nr:hypothetical protein [Paenibacillus albiflavus]TCZ75055.1 hypothetical protein E0485_18880 [Paenibacillus albiflavus]
MKKILTFVLAISMVAILAACGGSDKLTDYKSKDSKFQVSATSGWKDSKGQLHPESDLEIYNPQKEKYFMTLLESKEDFKDGSLQKYYDLVTPDFVSSIDAPKQGDVKEVTINGNKALQFTLEGTSGGVNVAYLITIIETPTHYGQLMAWTLKSNWDKYKDEYTTLVNSFKEAN